MQHGLRHEPRIAAVQAGDGVTEIDRDPRGQAGGDLQQPALNRQQQGRLLPRAADAAGQSTTAIWIPLPGLAW